MKKYISIASILALVVILFRVVVYWPVIIAFIQQCSTKNIFQEYNLNYTLSKEDILDIQREIEDTSPFLPDIFRLRYFLALHGISAQVPEGYSDIRSDFTQYDFTDAEVFKERYTSDYGFPIEEPYTQKELDQAIRNLHYCWQDGGVEGLLACEPGLEEQCDAYLLPPFVRIKDFYQDLNFIR